MGDERTFFVFADTVAARSFKQHNESHGWLGMRFQSETRGEPSQIIIHVRMLDEANVDQQEALGVIGVNLIYGAFYYHQPEKLIASLHENLPPERMQVDMIKFSGPAYEGVDNRLMSLQLVSQGLTDAVMFTADGESVQPAEILHKKAIIVERGSFRPVTYATNDMLEGARKIYLSQPEAKEEDLVVLMEMTLENLLAEGQLDHADFLARVDILGSLGRTVLISKFGEYYRLAGYLSRYTNQMVALVMGVPSLHEIFDEKYYLNLEGGILEALGRMFKSGLETPRLSDGGRKERRIDHGEAARGRAQPAPSLPIPDRQRLHSGDRKFRPRLPEDFSAEGARENARGRSGLGKHGAAGGFAYDQGAGFFGYRPSVAA